MAARTSRASSTLGTLAAVGAALGVAWALQNDVAAELLTGLLMRAGEAFGQWLATTVVT